MAKGTLKCFGRVVAGIKNDPEQELLWEYRSGAVMEDDRKSEVGRETTSVDICLYYELVR